MNAAIFLVTTYLSHWSSGPDNWILTSVVDFCGVWNLATNYHSANFLSFIQQTTSLLQELIQGRHSLDRVEETLYFTNINFFEQYTQTTGVRAASVDLPTEQLQ